VSEEKNVFWSLPVRRTNVFFVRPGGWDAKQIRSLRSRYKSVSPPELFMWKILCIIHVPIGVQILFSIIYLFIIYLFNSALAVLNF